MKILTVFLSILIFLTGCSTTTKKIKIEKNKQSFLCPEWRQEIVKNIPDLDEKEKAEILEGKIPAGMSKEKVEKILGTPYGKYQSDSKMMEVWFYDEVFVGFDKDGKVVKFGILKGEGK